MKYIFQLAMLIFAPLNIYAGVPYIVTVGGGGTNNALTNLNTSGTIYAHAQLDASSGFDPTARVIIEPHIKVNGEPVAYWGTGQWAAQTVQIMSDGDYDPSWGHMPRLTLVWVDQSSFEFRSHGLYAGVAGTELPPAVFTRDDSSNLSFGNTNITFQTLFGDKVSLQAGIGNGTLPAPQANTITKQGGIAIGSGVNNTGDYEIDIGYENKALTIASNGAVTAVSFTGSGAGLTSLNASSLSSGTVADARLSANVSLLGQTITASEMVGGLPGQILVSSGASVVNTNYNPVVGYFTNGPTYVVFKGDSLTLGFGWGATTATNSYPGRLMGVYLTGGNWIWTTNAGVAGQTMATMQVGYTNEVKTWKPAGGTNALLCFWAGINDLVASTTASNLFTTWSNYVALAHSDGFKVCALTVTPDSQLSAAQEKERIRFNDLLRESVGQWDYLYDAAISVPSPPDFTYYNDYVHFGDAGYDTIAYGVNKTLLKGQYNKWPLGATVTSTKTFMGNANTSRGMWSSIYANADFPGVMIEVKGGSGNFAAWTANPLTGTLDTFWHVGSGNIVLATDIIDRATATTRSFNALVVATNGFTSTVSNAAPVLNVTLPANDGANVTYFTNTFGFAIMFAFQGATGATVGLGTTALAQTAYRQWPMAALGTSAYVPMRANAVCTITNTVQPAIVTWTPFP